MNTSDVHIVTANSRVLHATDTHVHPSQTGHISCERLVLVLSRGSSVCRLKLLKKRMNDYQLPIAAHVTKRTIVTQCGWSPAALMRSIMRILHQGLCRAVGLYVSHSRCLFVVCTTIRQAKEKPMTDILGQGEGRDLDPCASVLICYERC